MNLIIVESPTKAKTISQFLGKEYKVESSYGHIRDLPKSRLGIDVENNFEPKYIIPLKAKKTVTALKKEVKKCAEVILATDEDREGEAIAWHLAEALKLDASKIKRIVFHEITKKAIDEALKNPRGLDFNRVDAQQARRVLDRIVGYKLSPFLWKKVAGGLSAGRVQSVALRLIADRENEIRNFKPEEYWTIVALLLKRGTTQNLTPGLALDSRASRGGLNNAELEALLTKIDGKALDKFSIKNKEAALKILADLNQCAFSISKIETKETHKTPLPPFTTSTLQQEAVKRLHYSSKKTMFLAQRLYENGHITYMRTDSVNLSAESTSTAKKWLEENLGAQYAAEAPRFFKTKSKLAQEAHEAVRPTDPGNMPEKIALADLGEKKLYELIWRRFIASQMPHARISTTTVEILVARDSRQGGIPPSLSKGLNRAAGQSSITNYQLRSSGQQILFDGYLKIWPQKFEEKQLPELKENEELELKEIKPEQHFTEPPARYSEASLIKTLEEYGIGRPSTYAPTISVIQIRRYVLKEQGRFKPTDIGELVNKVLTENFPEIVDVGFTAQMEDELDEIAAGRISWQGVISEFYEPFAKNLEAKYQEVSKKELIQEQTDEKCDKCGKPMIVKMSRFGKFLACSGFPECKSTKSLNNNESGGNEPPKSIGLKCPKCSDGEIVERRVHRGRARGKLFWGCSRYPACDYATWDNPIKEKRAD